MTSKKTKIKVTTKPGAMKVRATGDISITGETFDRLKAFAAVEGRPMGHLVDELILSFLEGEDSARRERTLGDRTTGHAAAARKKDQRGRIVETTTADTSEAQYSADVVRDADTGDVVKDRFGDHAEEPKIAEADGIEKTPVPFDVGDRVRIREEPRFHGLIVELGEEVDDPKVKIQSDPGDPLMAGWWAVADLERVSGTLPGDDDFGDDAPDCKVPPEIDDGTPRDPIDDIAY